MSGTSPPPEAQRFGRSQTPESPRPVHIPEPSNIPVLMNQMDPVFNDTATYNIPHNQTFSPFPEPSLDGIDPKTSIDEQDAVQNFFREAENQATAEPTVTSDLPFNINAHEITSFPSVSAPESEGHNQSHVDSNHATSREGNLAQAAVSIAPLSGDVGMQNAGQDTQLGSSVDETSIQIQASGQDGRESTAGTAATTTENESGVDYQSLLDTITQSASTAPAAESITAPTTTASHVGEVNQTLLSVPGLPPKPPPQANPVEFPSYSYVDSATNQQPSAASANGQDQIQGQNAFGFTPSSADQNVSVDLAQSSNGHILTDSSLSQFSALKAVQHAFPLPHPAPGQSVAAIENNKGFEPTERPWSPRTQQIYDSFLEDERRYVTEGIWDRFPIGSRLFVGNLPSEKVTKRDLFHTFHKHGQLAQISIKQAYGFVQFLEASSCSRALNAEQGVEIRGRKVHLEVSKPQKNTRNAGGGNNNNNNSNNKSNQGRRRSRSPDRGGRRGDRSYSDFRDEPSRRREEYRSRRSPSPRGYRSREGSRSGFQDTRSRSPIYGSSYSTAPIPAYDDEAALPIPRRDPRSVPDVQLLVLDGEVVQSFINWVEQSFRLKGLQASTTWLNDRLPLAAVIKRQIIEGVQAVVKLTRTAQNNSKIPLQVFDRTAGALNVNFNEYVDLDPPVAADIILQARQKERVGVQPFRPQTFPPHQIYQAQNQYGIPQPPMPYPPPLPPQYSAQQPTTPQQYSFPHQQSSYRPPTHPPATPTGQPPNLQQLLANLRQPAGQHVPQSPVNIPITQTPNLSSLLTQQQYGQSVGPNHFGQYGANPSPQGYGTSQDHQNQSQPNMQNIMEQLARYQR